MATAIRESLGEEVSADEHERLLQQASQTFRVLQQIMKHVKHTLLADVPREVARMGEGQYRALHLLSDERRITAGDLAGRCSVADPTMSKIVKSLESVGYVERQTDPDNRRVVWVSLTPKGRAMYEELVEHFGRGITSVLRPLTNAQLQDIITAFHHLESLIGDETDGENNQQGLKEDSIHGKH